MKFVLVCDKCPDIKIYFYTDTGTKKKNIKEKCPKCGGALKVK